MRDQAKCVACRQGYFINEGLECQLGVCGDGVVSGMEECDDGNTISGDGCSWICRL